MELSSARPDEAPVASQWEVRLLQVLSAGPQLLAVFVQLLQGFVAVDEVTVRGNLELHVLIALVSQLLIIIFKYLTGLLLPVKRFFMSTSEAFSCSTRVSSSAINKQGEVRPMQGTPNGYSTRHHRTFVLVAERLVFAHQLVTLRLHVLDFVMVLGEGAVEFRLEHGGVLPGLREFFLQCFRPEHCVAVSLEHVRFLSGSLHDILQEITTVTRVLSIYGRLTTQGYRQLTFIHRSAWCIASK
jgi:hypothetical protein